MYIVVEYSGALSRYERAVRNGAMWLSTGTGDGRSSRWFRREQATLTVWHSWWVPDTMCGPLETGNYPRAHVRSGRLHWFRVPV